MMQFVSALGLPVVGSWNCDPADAIAACTERAVEEGCRVRIVTQEEWLHQLCHAPHVHVANFRTRAIVQDADVTRVWKILPPFIPDVLTLAGDRRMGVSGTCSPACPSVLITMPSLPPQVYSASAAFEPRSYYA